ncbi:MAG: Glu/Leu/Phe/Val dehydrogenase [Nitriliruptoraceae bacterium]|nr:Glu/Leu/Phe/Val dehydrogenase [Nitriliruptoraceae bacterium]
METIFGRFSGHEQVVFGQDEATGLRCIIAIHSTKLGPAVGGTRFRPYPDDATALDDVLRLSEAMTYKSACAGLDAGGGKAVIIGDPATDATEGLLRAYGRVIASLDGRYVTACDVGTTPAHMAIIRRETRWATGMDPVDGGSGDSGVLTAIGVHLAMKASAAAAFGDPDLAGRHVAVQGLGKVGRRLVEHLVDEGAKVTVADVSETAIDGVASLPGVEVAPVDDVLFVDADIVSPNALGGVLSARTIEGLQAKVVCGGANNQLVEPDDGVRLHERGILYAPDYVVNAGGVINVTDELHPDGHDPARARRKAETIPATLAAIFARSAEDDVPTETAARAVAQARIDAVGGVRRFWLPR